MALKVTNTQYYSDIADAIRLKNGTNNTYLPSEMPDAIKDILFELPSGIRFQGRATPANLKNLDLSLCKISNITDTSNMFAGSQNQISYLDISNFDFSNLTSWINMFGDNYAGVNNSCDVLVKDQAAKDWINTNFSRLTNVRIKGV